jgi:class 3 adenylate cyclase
MVPLDVSAFVPARLADRVAAAGPPVEPSERCVQAAVLIADVVGFSVLAEGLARDAGSAGPEELNRRVEAGLAPVVDGILARGGDVVAFAGDSVIAAWYDDDPLVAAAACAVDLPRAVPVADGEPLRLRVGLAAGELIEDVVGGGGRWFSLVRGRVFEELRDVLAETDPGDVRVSRASLGRLAPLAETDEERLVSVRLRRVRAAPATHAAQDDSGETERSSILSLSIGGRSALTPFVPRPLVDRLDGAAAGWIAELRRITVAFVRMEGLADGAAPLGQVHAAIGALQATVEAADGVVLQVFVDEKGALALVAWGLPGATHEDDAARGALGALRIREALGGVGVATAVGVATGRVFCGVRGSATRREYGVLGTVVNLAARLMGAAGDEGVLCDEATVADAGERVIFDAPRERTVKGRDRPVTTRAPLAGGARPTPRSGVLRGREREREAFDHLLAQVAEGRFAALVVEGEPGMGKSALLRQLAATARERGARWILGWGDALETTTSYFAWRAFVAELLAGEGDVGARLAAIGLDPQLAPLLGPMVLDAPAETAATRALVGAPRAESTSRLLVALCAAAAKRGPVVLAVDDAHWLDSASLLVLQRLCADAPPLAVVIATRPTDAEGLRAVAREASVSSLAPLASEDLRAIAGGRLGATVDDALLAAIDARAEGNPFYAEEIALALRERGQLTVTDGVARLARPGDALEGLPTSLDALVTSRIDRLPAPVQTTLKAASVAGASFRTELLAAVHPAHPDMAALTAHLDVLQRGNFAVLDPVDPDAWRFRHRVVQEAAYELLLMEQRRALHRAVAIETERAHAEALAPWFGMLAEHWIRAGDTSRAMDALERAGDQALAAWANIEAAGFYERAIDLAGPDAPAPRRGRWLRRLGEARHHLGDLGASRRRAEESLATFGLPVPRTPGGRAWGLFRAVAEQARWQIAPARAYLSAAEADEAAREAALALGLVSTAGFWSGDVWALIYGTVAGANLTERLPPGATRALGYAGLAVVCGAVPLHGFADRYGRRGIAVAEASGDPDALGYARMMYGLYLVGAARLDQARAHVADAIAGYRALGHGRRVEECLTILYSEATLRDDLAALPAIAEEMWASARRRDDPQSLATGAAMRAHVADCAGDLDRAWALWEQVRYPDGDRLNQLSHHGRRADLALRRGDAGRARDEARAALRVLQDSTTMAGNVVEAPMLAARVLARTGEARDARALLAGMRRHGRAFPLWGPAIRLVEAEIARAEGRSSARSAAAALEASERLGLRSIARFARALA